MKKIFRLIIVLLVTAGLSAQTSNIFPVNNQSLGACTPASVTDVKMNGLLKLALTDFKAIQKTGGAPVYDRFIAGNQVRMFEGKNGKPYMQVFIQYSNTGETEKEVSAAGGIIESRIADILVATLPVPDIENIAAIPSVQFIEASGIAKPLLDSSRNAAKVTAIHAGTGLPKAYKGKNVIIGIIDSGIDWEHADFKNTSGSRILYLWDMARSGSAPAGYTYGYEYTKASIDGGQCLATDDNTGYGHGTHVAGIAAGGGSALAKYTGMAPEADIIFVKGFRYGAYFTDADVINGCNYIFTKAQALGKPAVINLSLGGNYGPHDGSSLYEKSLSALTGSGKIIVCASGNSGADNIHLSYSTAGTSFSTAYKSYWTIASESGSSLVDLWYDTGSINIGIAAYTKSGSLIGYTTAVAPGSKLVNYMFTVAGTTYGRVNIDATATSNVNNNSKEVLLQVDNVNGAYDLSVVDWVIYTYGSGTFDAWINSGGNFNTLQTGLIKGGDNAKSVAVPSTALKVFSIGAYTTKRQWTSTNGSSYYNPSAEIGKIALFSSMGPTRDGRTKPDFVAPGQLIASSLSGDLTIGAGVATEMIVTGGKHQMMQGTSMAAPHVSGVIALMLERKPSLDFAQAYTILSGSTVKDSYTGTTAGNVYGTGKMDAMAAMLATPNDITAENQQAKVFALLQNYPNPFNPETKIAYQLPNAEHVTLVIYDVLGNKIATLVDGFQQAGYHEAVFKSVSERKLASGMYIYQLQAGCLHAVQKMILLQ